MNGTYDKNPLNTTFNGVIQDGGNNQTVTGPLIGNFTGKIENGTINGTLNGTINDKPIINGSISGTIKNNNI